MGTWREKNQKSARGRYSPDWHPVASFPSHPQAWQNLPFTQVGKQTRSSEQSDKSQEGLEPMMASSLTAVVVILCDGGGTGSLEPEGFGIRGRTLSCWQGLETSMFAGKLLLVLVPI